MLNLPKIKKTLVSGLTHAERAKRVVVGVLLASTIAITTAPTGDVSANTGVAQTVQTSTHQALLLKPAQVPGIEIAYHYSHSSHSSHSSHASHHSHYSSRY